MFLSGTTKKTYRASFFSRLVFLSPSALSHLKNGLPFNTIRWEKARHPLSSLSFRSLVFSFFIAPRPILFFFSDIPSVLLFPPFHGSAEGRGGPLCAGGWCSEAVSRLSWVRALQRGLRRMRPEQKCKQVEISIVELCAVSRTAHTDTHSTFLHPPTVSYCFWLFSFLPLFIQSPPSQKQPFVLLLGHKLPADPPTISAGSLRWRSLRHGLRANDGVLTGSMSWWHKRTGTAIFMVPETIARHALVCSLQIILSTGSNCYNITFGAQIVFS